MEQTTQPQSQTDKKRGCLYYGGMGCLTIIVLSVVMMIILAAMGMNSLDKAKEKAQQNKAAYDAAQANDDSNSNAQQQNTNDVNTGEIKKEITYETLDENSQGMVILISPDYLNEADMTALGEKLKEETKNDNFAFIDIFTDKAAAELRDKVLADTASQTELDLYDKNYVATYKKNSNTGFHQYDIYFDGIMGSNHKTIDY